MPANQTYIRTQERYFSAHHDFLRLASFELHEAEEKQDVLYDRALVAITFSALAMEAFANAAGTKIVGDWDDFDKLSPFVKLKFLATYCKLEPDMGKEPWQTLRSLHKFRNEIAHPKSEQINKTVELTDQAEINTFPDPPKSNFEARVNLEFAQKAYKAMRTIQELICSAIPEQNVEGLRSDSWIGTGYFANDPTHG
jgi:hypothetical protein